MKLVPQGLEIALCQSNKCTVRARGLVAPKNDCVVAYLVMKINSNRIQFRKIINLHYTIGKARNNFKLATHRLNVTA